MLEIKFVRTSVVTHRKNPGEEYLVKHLEKSLEEFIKESSVVIFGDSARRKLPDKVLERSEAAFLEKESKKYLQESPLEDPAIPQGVFIEGL